MTNRPLQQGDHVDTPYGSGRVGYLRMAPPDYRAIEAVSVVLDDRRHLPGYRGTIFAASDVRAALAGKESGS